MAVCLVCVVTCDCLVGVCCDMCEFWPSICGVLLRASFFLNSSKALHLGQYQVLGIMLISIQDKWNSSIAQRTARITTLDSILISSCMQ